MSGAPAGGDAGEMPIFGAKYGGGGKGQEPVI